MASFSTYVPKVNVRKDTCIRPLAAQIIKVCSEVLSSLYLILMGVIDINVIALKDQAIAWFDRARGPPKKPHGFEFGRHSLLMGACGFFMGAGNYAGVG
jgi:hypothetical protein